MAAEGVGAVSFVFPGDPATRTGGFIYDRTICDRLAARGWDAARLDAFYGGNWWNFLERSLPH